VGELTGIVRFTFHEGRLEEFKRLSAECLEIVRTEPGTLQYDTFFNADETEAIVIERFVDSDALVVHGQNMAEMTPLILETGACHGELLGDVSDELKANFDPDGPVQLFAPWQTL
jgi:quinol monooxygenase YgiN